MHFILLLGLGIRYDVHLECKRSQIQILGKFCPGVYSDCTFKAMVPKLCVTSPWGIARHSPRSCRPPTSWQKKCTGCCKVLLKHREIACSLPALQKACQSLLKRLSFHCAFTKHRLLCAPEGLLEPSKKHLQCHALSPNSEVTGNNVMTSRVQKPCAVFATYRGVTGC